MIVLCVVQCWSVKRENRGRYMLECILSPALEDCCVCTNDRRPPMSSPHGGMSHWRCAQMWRYPKPRRPTIRGCRSHLHMVNPDTVGTKIIADPENSFQKLISHNLLILLWDRSCLELIIVSSSFRPSSSYRRSYRNPSESH